jgi:SAM-dependent methyltransferase
MLGHSPREIQRLMHQAALLRPTTQRLLRSAGARPGMHVLDLGCGAGDVSLLAAELVGPSGSVVGVDRSSEALVFASQRARAADLRHVEFRQGAAEAFSSPELFDLVIGRFVLVHQVDPVALLRNAARLVRPGGVVVFQEPNLHGAFLSLPRVALWEQVGEWVLLAFRMGLRHPDAGGRLIEHFARAGLPSPKLFSEALVGGGADSQLYAWAANVFESVRPQLDKMGIDTAEAGAIETLEHRLRQAVVEPCSQVTTLAQVCAWTRIR